MLKIPTLADLSEQVRQKFRAYMPGSDAWVWPNNIGVTAKVIAGTLSALYSRLDYLQRQAFAVTADDEFLDRHAAGIGLSRRPALPASGSVDFTGTAAFAVITGAILQRADGQQFAVLTGGNLAVAGTLTLPVQAISGGAQGLTLSATQMTVVSGLTGTATAEVSSGGLTGGSDVEDRETFRARILFRKRNPYAGGSASDYVTWAMSVTGVTRVYVERLWAGPGTVRVFPITDALTINGIPSAATLAAVSQVIALNAPAGALVTVAAAVALPVNITVTGLQPATTAMQNAAKAAIADAFIQHGAVAGNDTAVSVLPFLSVPYSFSLSWLWQAVANASGSLRHTLTSPATDVTISAGRMPVPGTVTFV